jgi:hypothetical protein
MRVRALVGRPCLAPGKAFNTKAEEQCKVHSDIV